MRPQNLSSLRDNYFSKKLPFNRREINGQTSLPVSTMTGVIALSLISTKYCDDWSDFASNTVTYALKPMQWVAAVEIEKSFSLRRRNPHGQSFQQ